MPLPAADFVRPWPSVRGCDPGSGSKQERRRAARAADLVIGAENARAISLSWGADVRGELTEEIPRRLRGHADVPLTLQMTLTMARPGGLAAARRPAGPGPG